MFEYKINIDKKVLRLLGAQLYGDTPSIIAELVQNAYDADAKDVWITIYTGQDTRIIVQDNGTGMTPKEINDRFLNIGQNRRDTYPKSPKGRKVLGRKGIGKLAVFSLAKVVDVYSIKDEEHAACRLDFDDITLHNNDPKELSSEFVIEKEFLSDDGTGTKIELHQIQKNISNSLNYIVNRLARTFDVNSEDFRVHIRKNNEEYKTISRANLDFFQYMDTIVTFGDEYDSKIEEIKNNEINEKYKYTIKYSNLSEDGKMQKMPCEITVNNKNGVAVNCNFSFSGWIGTIHDRPSFKKLVTTNFSEKDSSKFEVSVTDNRVTVFSRGKIGEFDILPKTHTNRIADAYVIGELYADIFEDDDLTDMAISNRRGYDETDQRYVQLISVVSEVINFITRRKEEINKKRKSDREREETERVKNTFKSRSSKTNQAINEKFSEEEKKSFEEELFQFGRAINMSNSTKKIFISHKAECAPFGKFLVECFRLIDVDIKKDILFTSMPELGVPYNQDIYDYLKDCFRDDLFVIFLFSRSFYNSNICIAETGAAWATNQQYSNVVLDMSFSGIDKPINNCQIGVSLNDLDNPDLKYNLCQLLKHALQAINSPVPNDKAIYNAIDTSLEKYKDELHIPSYLPNRKYLAVPICPTCGSQMKLSIDENNIIKYTCLSKKCGASIEATIE